MSANSSRTDRNLKKQEEIASKKIISQTTKKCPGCKRSIEKSFGCDHMTCKIPSLHLCAFMSFEYQIVWSSMSPITSLTYI
jgi:hypothetical protein